MLFRRRKYLVNAGLQMKITLSFLAASLIGCIAATAVFNHYAMKKLETLMWSTHINIKDTGEIIRSLFLYVNIVDIAFVFIMFLIAVAWMMKKTKGPLIRMSKDLMKVAEGDLSITMALRQKDEFQDTAQELNAMITTMRNGFKSIDEQHIVVSDSLEDLKGKSESESIKKNCALILEKIKDLEGELNNFQLGSS